MLENQKNAPSAPAPAANNGVRAAPGKMVMFGVEVDAPPGQETPMMVAHLPKQRGAILPVVIGLALIGAAVVSVFEYSKATDAEHALAAKTTELDQARTAITALQKKTGEQGEQLKALEAEKATLTADVAAKAQTITELEAKVPGKKKK